MLRGIYSAIYGEVNVSVSGGYVLQYAGGTRASSCFISATLKSLSGRKLLGPTTYIINLWLLGTGMALNIMWSVEQVTGLSDVFVSKLQWSVFKSADELAQCVQRIVPVR
jgi:hypothetical protein